MKKNTVQIIIGAPRSGKTKKVAELTAGKSSVVFYGQREYLDGVNHINSNTEFIAIEGVDLRDFTFVEHLYGLEKLRLGKLYQTKVDVIDMPNLIFTTVFEDYAAYKTKGILDVEIIQL